MPTIGGLPGHSPDYANAARLCLPTGYGRVQQAIDTEDSRKHQTFLTAKGRALMREIVRLIRSDDQRALNLRLRGRGLVKLAETSQDLARDQWLRRLTAAGRKLDADDIQLAVRQIEVLIGRRQSEKPR